MIGLRRNPRPWTWDQVRGRTLVVYASTHGDRSRTAVLVWQGDDPRVAVGDAAPPLLAFTMDVEQEADADNAVALAGFDSLERARTHCIQWAGTTDEADWTELGEAAQIAIYASIREPGFAQPG